ncbi:Pectate lyase superfamily protein [Roseivivax jejudonensis]|uniref:Pectate lyase superfamily protein n=1 Tax=Roseivivax jejudonensis TaxID=1529041 RepID=A0A1X6YGG0_9RHOB|nr:glycosyl hydrolase family 28-related protein [Roseivivax jejudonensis]SLN20785.1 Pectate lyase superfamily protein [Roseivivax jejudonensis]
MNKAITDGIVFQPTAFSAGLGVWSSEDGTPGSDTYAGSATAAFVPSDADFGGALELQKTDGTHRVRFMGETPILPGCYLRITARVKAVSGNLPAVRIGAWAARGDGTHLGGVTEAGPATALTAYGEVVQVSAIVGTGNRSGVDMVWGTQAAYGHFGIDLTGPDGGIVRVDDIEIEDVTAAFLRDLVPWVDVRDYGARGDGTGDDAAAFELADADADGRAVFVSAGSYRIASSITMDSPMIFEGRLQATTGAIVSFTKSFDLPTYIAAFGDEGTALRKGLQALLNNADHDSLDMGGRRVTLDAPLDMRDAVPNRSSYAQRRILRNGQIGAAPDGDWAPEVVTSQARYAAEAPTRLTQVTNVANVPVGALVTGAGVGREIYVRSRNVSAQEITLSQPLSDAAGVQTYTFTRFRYLLDLSGFSRLDAFQIDGIEFQCAEVASGVLLPPVGVATKIRDCTFNRPGHRAITSHGAGCQGLMVERCNFMSFEGGTPAQNRVSVAMNANANDIKIRDNRASQFRHFLVTSGAQGLIAGNHFFQGDASANGLRTAGIVVALRACNTSILGNYVDNCFVEWTNEREPEPDYAGGFGFAGLTIADNVFLCSNVAPSFSFIVLKPFGRDHRLNGLNISGNNFRASGVVIDRVERVDTSFAPLDVGASRQVSVSNNSFNNVEFAIANPLRVRHAQNSVADTWVVGTGGRLPFGGEARGVDSLVYPSRLRNGANVSEWVMPYVSTGEGPDRDRVHVIFPEAVRGDLDLAVRMD